MIGELELAAGVVIAAELLKPKSPTPAPLQAIPTQPDIEALGLAGTASLGTKGAAYHLRAKFGTSIVFTSGHRDPTGQCNAMAGKIVASRNRNWIQATYKHTSTGALASPVSQALQNWVTANPQATTQAQIAAGLLSVCATFTSAQLGTLSKHLETPAEAFDVHVIAGNTAIPAYMTTLAKAMGGTYLSSEGGVAVWHYQCSGTAAVPAV